MGASGFPSYHPGRQPNPAPPHPSDCHLHIRASLCSLHSTIHFGVVMLLQRSLRLGSSPWMPLLWTRLTAFILSFPLARRPLCPEPNGDVTLFCTFICASHVVLHSKSRMVKIRQGGVALAVILCSHLHPMPHHTSCAESLMKIYDKGAVDALVVLSQSCSAEPSVSGHENVHLLTLLSGS